MDRNQKLNILTLCVLFLLLSKDWKILTSFVVLYLATMPSDICFKNKIFNFLLRCYLKKGNVRQNKDGKKSEYQVLDTMKSLEGIEEKGRIQRLFVILIS